MGIINEKLQMRNVMIGKIDIMKKFSFFEIDVEFQNNILKVFDGARFKGEPLLVELVKNKRSPAERRPIRRKKKKHGK